MPTDLDLETQRSNDLRQSRPGRLKRVLFVLSLDPAGKFGAIEEQTLILARSFRDRGSLFLPVFLRPLDSESADLYAREGLGVESLDLSHFRLGVLRRLLGLISQHRIEIVHWNFYHPFLNGYLWALLVLKPRVENYFTDHISRPGLSQRRRGRAALKSKFRKILMSSYARIFCISDFVLSQVRTSAGLHAERIHYFINTDRFRPDPVIRRQVRDALGVGEKFVAVAVAHLIKQKGVDVAIKALMELPEDIILCIVGDGPERPKLAALVQELGLGPRVQFLGPRRNVEPVLQAADCAVCPSVWAEAVGLVNPEALACGLPVVASRIGGIPEYIEDGRNGFLFTAGDHHELAARIRQLHDDVELRNRMGAIARAIAVEAHSTQSRLGDRLSVYEAEAPIP